MVALRLPSCLLIALLASACGEDAGNLVSGSPPRSNADVPRVWVVTEVPAGVSAGLASPEERYPIGSRVVLVGGDGTPPLLLSEGLVAAGGAAVDPAGRAIAFTGREAPGAPWAIWRAAPDGGPPARVAGLDGADAFEPAWLPDGRLVFVGREREEGPAGRATALFVARPGDAAHAITFGAGAVGDPSVLPDGRILAAAWGPGPEGLGRWVLLALHPDGTGAWRLAGTPSFGAPPLRPRAHPAGDVAWLEAGPGRAGRLRVRPAAAPREVVAGGFSEAPGLLACEPLAEEGWIATDARGEVRSDAATAAAALAARSSWRATHVVPLAPRPRPQGHLSTVDPLRGRARLLALDARAAGAVAVRLAALDGPWAGGIRPPGRALGEAPLAPDGSLFAETLPDVPLRLELLDAAGQVVRRCAEPFWVRPGETRTCVGCHHASALAPANRRPEAVRHDAVGLRGEEDAP